ncbi:Phosphoenolpyruvate carboxykinase [ATP] [Bifiguratus adelaidae]|uniref:Phosphoenolpyruvate carboxykinase (ATP) n=1 Tax=Bifiguratus adelaidae TaxID=1938954 RepID=A0A261XWD1_9FUNG|nr:Phosphoenolpyruvate carboxykinase [ATP] [Bifiguratus adelaidae]
MKSLSILLAAISTLAVAKACETDCRNGVAEAFAGYYGKVTDIHFNELAKDISQGLWTSVSSVPSNIQQEVTSAVTDQVKTMNQNFNGRLQPLFVNAIFNQEPRFKGDCNHPKRVQWAMPPDGVNWTLAECDAMDYICGNPPSVCHFLPMIKVRLIKNMQDALSSYTVSTTKPMNYVTALNDVISTTLQSIGQTVPSQLQTNIQTILDQWKENSVMELCERADEDELCNGWTDEIKPLILLSAGRPATPTKFEEDLHNIAGIDWTRVDIKRNLSVPVLYEEALTHEEGTVVSSAGALCAYSGKKTGRSPKDKRIVDEETSTNDIWWGPVNIKMTEKVFMINRERAIDYLNTRERLYVFDGFAGWDPKYRIKVRVVASRAYHILFMRNMLIRPTEEELENFGQPDITIYNAGCFPSNRYTTGMTSTTSVSVNFKRGEMVILGTEYAGEMKKGVFTIMHYLMPKAGVLSLHSSANEGPDEDVSLFFGLSGTGKTTLSADPKRKLIGDDEHCWSDTGVFNIEGGCYAKCIDLSAEKEPEIFNAIRFGSVLENVVLDEESRIVDYSDDSLTENTRCAYPIDYISNAKIPCMGGHPKNIILLTCDAFGVLPPVSKLTTSQAMYHFISGYTTKIPGTEDGITEPIATFSACFGAPFLVLHPQKYATMLAEKMATHKADAWLINTGWVGGSPKNGAKRCPLKYTRAILDAIHSGELANAEYETFEVFGLQIPKAVTNVPSELLHPRKAWTGSEQEFRQSLENVAAMFNENFKTFADEASPDTLAAAPKI